MYDHNSRSYKIAIPTSSRIGVDRGMTPDQPMYSTITVSADSPHIDSRSILDATKELQRIMDRQRREYEYHARRQAYPVYQAWGGGGGYAAPEPMMNHKMWEMYRHMMQPMKRPEQPRHVCAVGVCKPTQVDFYKAKLDYLRQMKPVAYQKAYSECCQLMCLIDRIEKR